jgi:fumarylpyruvate hydrolase
MPTPFLFEPPSIQSLPIQGQSQRFPIRRLFFVGRNYMAHAAEMGFSVDKSTETPFYFTKSPYALAQSNGSIAYASGTSNYHYELELVVAIGTAGFQVSSTDAHQLIYGYGVGLDMTRRDLQFALRDKGRPWDLAKDVEMGAVCSEIVPMQGVVKTTGKIELEVNGQVRQKADISQLIWNIPEIIEDLSRYYHLQPGDLIYTGTPEGVGPVQPGDHLRGSVEGITEVTALVVP